MANKDWCDNLSEEDYILRELDIIARLCFRAELEVLVALELFDLSIDDMEYILRTLPMAESYQTDEFGFFALGG